MKAIVTNHIYRYYNTINTYASESISSDCRFYHYLKIDWIESYYSYILFQRILNKI